MFKFPIWMPNGIMAQWRCDCPFCKLGNLYKEGRDHSRLVIKPTNEYFWKSAIYFHFKSICIFKSRLFYIQKGTICKGPLPGTEYSYPHLRILLLLKFKFTDNLLWEGNILHSHWSLPDKHVISAWWAMWSVPDQPRHQCMRSHVISAW